VIPVSPNAARQRSGQRRPPHLHLRTELVHAQRDKLNDLYRRGKISDEIRRSLAGTLDQQERGRL
jgi:hypothetical protein